MLMTVVVKRYAIPNRQLPTDIHPIDFERSSHATLAAEEVQAAVRPSDPTLRGFT
jgi:hypothetical protein